MCPAQETVFKGVLRPSSPFIPAHTAGIPQDRTSLHPAPQNSTQARLTYDVSSYTEAPSPASRQASALHGSRPPVRKARGNPRPPVLSKSETAAQDEEPGERGNGALTPSVGTHPAEAMT